MEIKLSKVQKRKIEILSEQKLELQNQLYMVQTLLNEITDIILDINKVDKDKVKNIGYQNGKILVNMKEETKLEEITEEKEGV
jgi:chaperonin cofactor prefoldin